MMVIGMTKQAVMENEVKEIRLGNMVRTKYCNTLPEMIGEFGRVVDLQMQEYERYRQYPLWAKMLSGELKGKVCGFHYDEVEVSHEATLKKPVKVKGVEQPEEILVPLVVRLSVGWATLPTSVSFG